MLSPLTVDALVPLAHKFDERRGVVQCRWPAHQLPGVCGEEALASNERLQPRAGTPKDTIVGREVEL